MNISKEIKNNKGVNENNNNEILKNSKSSSSLISDSSDSVHKNNINVEEDIYSPSLKNGLLRNIIIHHQNITPNDILLIDNNCGGNCFYNSVSYHISPNS